MKNLALLFAFTILSLNSSGQIKGVNLEEAISMENVDPSDYFKIWIKMKDKGYTMLFKQNTVGYKHLIEKTRDILKENELSFTNPTKDDSLLPYMADSYVDFSNVSHGVNIGEGEISKVWRINDYYLVMVANEGRYSINIYFGE